MNKPKCPHCESSAVKINYQHSDYGGESWVNATCEQCKHQFEFLLVLWPALHDISFRFRDPSEAPHY